MENALRGDVARGKKLYCNTVCTDVIGKMALGEGILSGKCVFQIRGGDALAYSQI